MQFLCWTPLTFLVVASLQSLKLFFFSGVRTNCLWYLAGIFPFSVQVSAVFHWLKQLCSKQKLVGESSVCTLLIPSGKLFLKNARFFIFNEITLYYCKWLFCTLRRWCFCLHSLSCCVKLWNISGTRMLSTDQRQDFQGAIIALNFSSYT